MVAKAISLSEQRQPNYLTVNVPESSNARGVAPLGRMRVQIVNKASKKKDKKRSKRFLEIMKSMPQPRLKSPRYVDKFNSPRDRVQLALRKFDELLSSHAPKRGSSTFEVLKLMKRWHPDLFVNLEYSTLGRFGHVPGVEVGDCFNWAAELRLVGLHRLPQSGIDWKDVTTRFYRKESVALSILVIGEYEDNFDNGETLLYTGHGGKEKGAKHQTKDQKLVGGNLALCNSISWKNSIRVIRGRRDASRPSKRVYSYDGLYKVVDYVLEEGKSGFGVYKFKLVREKDQAPLFWPPQA